MHVLTPGSIGELVECLGEMTPESRILAGGTDLIIAMRTGAVAPDKLLDLSGVAELDGIRLEAGDLVIGAGTSFARIERDPLVLSNAPCLAEAAAAVGSVQIRNRATLGGNLATASPAGDALPPLLVLASVARIIDRRGAVRAVPLEKFLTGPYTADLACGEALIDIRFRARPLGSTFVKLGSRSTVTIARLSVAMGVRMDDDSGAIDEARVTLGAVGRTAFRAPSVEAVMVGNRPSPDLADRVAAALVREVEASIPGRATLPYKREAVVGVARQAWRRLFG